MADRSFKEYIGSRFYDQFFNAIKCGHAFSEKYGNAANNFEALKRIIDQVTDIPLLGSAIYSQWRYFNHWAYSGAEILEPQNREWFIIALSHLGKLADQQLMRVRGVPYKVRIVSNNICYGPVPEPDDEIEQHITINSEGRVWFSAYNFGAGFGKHKKVRNRNYKIEKNTATSTLDSIASYFRNEYTEIFATDIGEWLLEITSTEGVVYKFRGSLMADFEVNGVDLSDMVREALDMDDLYVFDGNNKPDRVDRIRVSALTAERLSLTQKPHFAQTASIVVSRRPKNGLRKQERL